MYGLYNFNDMGTVLAVTKDDKGRLTSTEVPCPCSYCAQDPPVRDAQHLKFYPQPPADAPAQEGLLVIDWNWDTLQIRKRVPCAPHSEGAEQVPLKNDCTEWMVWRDVFASFTDIEAMMRRAGIAQDAEGRDSTAVCGCHFCRFGAQRPDVQHLKGSSKAPPEVEFFLNIDWGAKMLEIKPKL